MMKLGEKLALLKEHANLVQTIPTLKALDKIKSLKRLSEIIVLLGGQENLPATLGELVIDEKMSNKERRKAVETWLKDNLQGKTITTVDGKQVRFNRKDSVEHLVFDSRYSPLASKAIGHIADVFKNGQFIGREALTKERKDDFIAFHTYEKQVEIDDKKVLLQAKAGEKSDGTLQTLDTLIAYHQKVKAMLDDLENKKGHFLPSIKSMDLNGELALNKNNSTMLDSLQQDDEATLTILQILDENGQDITDAVLSDDTDTKIDNELDNILKLIKTPSYKEIHNNHVFMGLGWWSNGQFAIQEAPDDRLVSEMQSYVEPDNHKEFPAGRLGSMVGDWQHGNRLELAGFANGTNQVALNTADGKRSVVLGGRLFAYVLRRLQKNHGKAEFEFWQSHDRPVVAIAKDGQLVAFIMPIDIKSDEKLAVKTADDVKNEQNAKSKMPITPAIDETKALQMMNELAQTALQKNQHQAQDKTNQNLDNGKVVSLDDAYHYLLSKIAKGDTNKAIYAYLDDKFHVTSYKVMANTKGNHTKFYKDQPQGLMAHVYTIPNPSKYDPNKANIDAARILENLGYGIDRSEKDSFYPKNPLPKVGDWFIYEGHNGNELMMFSDVSNQGRLADEATLHFYTIDGGHFQPDASHYDELLANGKLTPVSTDDLDEIAKVLDFSQVKNHSLYQTRANGTKFLVKQQGFEWQVQEDDETYAKRFKNKQEVIMYLRRNKEDYYPALKFVDGKENLLSE